MTETIQDIFVDSESLGSYGDFTVYLPHPVMINENEKAYIRLKDYQQLNSFYNISTDLENNLLSIIKTDRTYSRTPSGTAVGYFNHTDMFQQSGGNINKPILNTTNNGTAHTETLTPNAGDYTIKLYDATITTTGTVIPANSKFNNIFKPTITIADTAYMSFNPDDYLIFYNSISPTSSRFINSMTFSIQNVIEGIPPSSNVYISLKIWGSVDGITWVETALGMGQSPALGYNTYEWVTPINDTRTFTLVSADTYQYHKVSFETIGFTTPATDFKNKIRFRQIYFTRIPSYVETFVDTPSTYNHTIENGAYSLTNVNLYLNYILKQNISQNLTFTTSYPNQSFLNAQNKQILSWGSAEPDYYYKATDKTDEYYKVEIVFNNVLKNMLGWTAGNPIIFKNDTPLEAPKYLNLINFKKILLTSSLKLTTKPYTFLNKTYTKATGIGDVIMWIAKDIPSFSYINYTNPTDSKIEIDDKIITKINFKILNEYAQVLNDVPSCLFHLQIIKTIEGKI